MQDDRKRTVATGYDRLSHRYSEWAAQVEGDPRDRMLAGFAERLAERARVLDLGCGSGIPSTKALAQRFEVVGVDISEAQICLARQNVPEATFIYGDVAEIEFPDALFDGVTDLYSMSHLPREEHGQLLTRIARWLAPGGLFLATLGARDNPPWVGDWLGVPHVLQQLRRRNEPSPTVGRRFRVRGRGDRRDARARRLGRVPVGHRTQAG